MMVALHLTCKYDGCSSLYRRGVLHGRMDTEFPNIKKHIFKIRINFFFTNKYVGESDRIPKRRHKSNQQPPSISTWIRGTRHTTLERVAC